MKTRYFKIETYDGSEYAFKSIVDENKEMNENDIIKLALKCGELPESFIDEFDTAEEITMREYDEINQIIPTGN